MPAGHLVSGLVSSIALPFLAVGVPPLKQTVLGRFSHMVVTPRELGTGRPSEKPQESLDWAVLGLDDQEVSCPG